jgi:hypothetical protein
MSKELPDTAETVVIGTGAVGCSVVFHPPELGFSA